MKRTTHFYRSVAAVMACIMAWQPIVVRADEMSQIGREAQGFGKTVAGSLGTGSINDNALSIPGDDATISINELFPGQQPGQDAGKYFPHSPNLGEIKGVYNSDDEMSDFGQAAHSGLEADSKSESPSIQGAAYDVLIGSVNRSRPDFANDPMLNQSRDTYDNIDLITEQFGDCSIENTYTQGSRETHVPDYQRCERVTDKSGQCTLTHTYDAGVLAHAGGPYNFQSCGAGCSKLWIGRVGDNYWSGWCSVFEQSTQVEILNPDAITSAVFEYAKWDDYMQVWIGPVGSEVKVWQGPNGNFPPETGGACELEESWSRSPNIDVTKYFKNVEPGTIINFKIRVSVAGEGEGYGRVRINYDPSKAILEDKWESEECYAAAQALTDGFASGSLTCTENPADANGCTVLNGVQVCEDDLSPAPSADISNLCRKATVETSYDFYKGQMDCWTDPQGDVHCPVNEGGNLNSCQEYEENPQCGFISSECVDGAKGASGTCYVFTDTYDCGTDVTIPTTEKDREIQCSGPIRCMGTDCLDIGQSQDNTADFARASALMQAAQFMAQDMSCLGVDENGNPTGEENVTCSVFEGDPGECKIAVGGVQDCCEKPSNISMRDYLSVLMTAPKIDSAILSLSDGSDLSGLNSSYQILRDPLTSGWAEVTKPFTSQIDSISGVYDTVSGQVSDFAAEAIKALKGAFTDQTTTAVGNAVVEGGVGQGAAGEAGKGMAEQILGEAGASMLGNIMLAYQIYVVTMVVIQIVWKCEEDEFRMNAQRELNNCHYVGSYCKTEVLGGCIEKRESYCCFNSPLSRIIQQQARPQLGMNWGDAESPSCGGIPVSRIAELDWDRINLDEWLGLLQQNNLMPNASTLGIEKLTGAGSDFDIFGEPGGRANAQERAMKRFEGIDTDAVRKETAEELQQYYQ